MTKNKEFTGFCVFIWIIYTGQREVSAVLYFDFLSWDCECVAEFETDGSVNKNYSSLVFCLAVHSALEPSVCTVVFC